jgi:hypothetical protein
LPPSSGAQSGCSLSAPYGTRNTGIGRQRRQHTHRHTDTHQRANSPTTTRARDTKHTESPYTAITHPEWQMTPTQAQDARTGLTSAFTALFHTTPTTHQTNSTFRRQIFCGEGSAPPRPGARRLPLPPYRTDRPTDTDRTCTDQSHRHRQDSAPTDRPASATGPADRTAASATGQDRHRPTGQVAQDAQDTTPADNRTCQDAGPATEPARHRPTWNTRTPTDNRSTTTRHNGRTDAPGPTQTTRKHGRNRHRTRPARPVA